MIALRSVAFNLMLSSYISVYTERWFRLKGNLLFYLRNRDPCSEPQGLIVLEHCHVEMGPRNQTMFCFSLGPKYGFGRYPTQAEVFSASLSYVILLNWFD